MSVSQFLQSDKKLADLTRLELYNLLTDKSITPWLYEAVSKEMVNRIS